MMAGARWRALIRGGETRITQAKVDGRRWPLIGGD
jgi:hypothetical protein